MYRPILITPPAAAPVSLDEMKLELRRDDTADDLRISDLIGEAVDHLDGWSGILGRCLMSQTWRQDFDDFRSCLRLPLFPVASVTSVKYTDTANAEQTIDAANYDLRCDASGYYVEFKSSYSFPALNAVSAAVRIQHVCGHASADDVPRAFKQAIKLHVKMNYEPMRPEDLAAYQRSFDAIVSPKRRIGV